MKLSRREIQRMRKRVQELEEMVERQRYAWSRDWPGGSYFGSLRVDEVTKARIHTARVLKHAVVVTVDGENINFYALQLAS